MKLLLKTLRRAGRSLPTLALLMAGACGDEILAPAYGAGCNVGTLTPGTEVTGAFTYQSCLNPYNFWTEYRTYYESRTVRLTAGHAYLFHEGQVPDPENGYLDEVDAVLTLWGLNGDGVTVPLAISDDDGGGPNSHDSEIFFVAPKSGAYQLVAGTYDDEGLGGYKLTGRECPVLGALDTTGTYTFHLDVSPCERHLTNPTKYVFLTLDVAAFERIDITITSSDFTPTWELFGIGFDVYANLHAESSFARGYTGGQTTTITPEAPGTATLAIGGTAAETAGAFQVRLTRTAPATAPWTDGRLTLKPSLPQKAR